MQYFARLNLRKHGKCNILLGWAFESTIAPHLFSFGISVNAILCWAFENEGGNDMCSRTISKTPADEVNAMLRSVELSKWKKCILCWARRDEALKSVLNSRPYLDSTTLLDSAVRSDQKHEKTGKQCKLDPLLDCAILLDSVNMLGWALRKTK